MVYLHNWPGEGAKDHAIYNINVFMFLSVHWRLGTDLCGYCGPTVMLRIWYVGISFSYRWVSVINLLATESP